MNSEYDSGENVAQTKVPVKADDTMSDGRSITIDIYAVDGDEKIYDIEVQCASAGADAHWARFHSSMIDTKMLKERQDFKEIHDSYVIFITESDVMGTGRSLYHIDRK